MVLELIWNSNHLFVRKYTDINKKYSQWQSVYDQAQLLATENKVET